MNRNNLNRSILKSIPALLVILLFVFLTVSFFIPVKADKQVFVANTFQNISSSIMQPKTWVKWDAAVRSAWQKDSSAFHYDQDSARQTLTIDIPGKKIRVTQISYLLYQLEEIKKKGDHSVFGLSIVPYVGNGQKRSEHNSYIVYSRSSNLFYKLFPFLEKISFAKRTVSDLTAFLEDNTRYYGFPIGIKQTTDSFFLTKKEDLSPQTLFSRIPTLFREIDQYARENNCKPGIKNISYSPLGHDSLTLMAGYNIDKPVKGDYLYIFRQFPGDQVLAVGAFKGPYRDRILVYSAMQKYLSDHQLISIGLPYERFLSALPIADSSLVDLELCYPLRSF
ncbi:hypothetical protein ACX0G9_22965 [Flavitalea flava]